MDNNNWYTQQSEDDWYRPQKCDNGEKQQKKLRKPRPGVKAGMIVAFVLILVAASAVAFSGNEKGVSGNSAQDFLPEADSDRIFTYVPDFFTEDFRDYFKIYYETEGDESGSKIPHGKLAPNLSMTIVSANGRTELSLGEVYDACVDSIVGIAANTKGGIARSWGTGVIMSEDGYIITNAHIIDGAEGAVVHTSDGAEYEALLVGEDTKSDIAVLKIEAKGLQAAEFGASGELGVGDPVVAIGNPLGKDFTGTMTNGIISAISRDVLYAGHYMSLLQTNTAINEGNSGGPLINMYGQVIGITNMKMVANISSATIEGIGFAIPSATVKEVVDDLLSVGTVQGRPGMGLMLGVIPEEAMEHYNLPSGLYVSEVVEKSGADIVGIMVGDVVTHVNGKSVKLISDVNLARDGFKVGDKVALTIYRSGETFDVWVELMDMNDLY